MNNFDQAPARLVAAFEINAAGAIQWSTGHVESCAYASSAYRIVLGEGRGLSPRWWVQFSPIGAMPAISVSRVAGTAGYGEPANPINLYMSQTPGIISIYESVLPNNA
jgi:hypothetical protein